jgi:TonB family protein
LSICVKGTSLVNIRTAVLAVPIVAGLAAASANASTLTLSPLGPSHPERVAALGDSCAVPYAPPRASNSFVQYPTVAKVTGVEGVATVGITLSPAGRVVRAWRMRSTGNALLDNAALDAAQYNSYVAERSECSSVGGDYKVEVDFSLDP